MGSRQNNRGVFVLLCLVSLGAVDASYEGGRHDSDGAAYIDVSSGLKLEVDEESTERARAEARRLHTHTASRFDGLDALFPDVATPARSGKRHAPVAAAAPRSRPAPPVDTTRSDRAAQLLASVHGAADTSSLLQVERTHRTHTRRQHQRRPAAPAHTVSSPPPVSRLASPATRPSSPSPQSNSAAIPSFLTVSETMTAHVRHQQQQQQPVLMPPPGSSPSSPSSSHRHDRAWTTTLGHRLQHLLGAARARAVEEALNGALRGQRRDGADGATSLMETASQSHMAERLMQRWRHQHVLATRLHAAFHAVSMPRASSPPPPSPADPDVALLETRTSAVNESSAHNGTIESTGADDNSNSSSTGSPVIAETGLGAPPLPLPSSSSSAATAADSSPSDLQQDDTPPRVLDADAVEEELQADEADAEPEPTADEVVPVDEQATAGELQETQDALQQSRQSLPQTQFDSMSAQQQAFFLSRARMQQVRQAARVASQTRREQLGLSTKAKDKAKLTDVDPWWLKDLPWWMPPPPDWGALPPTMFNAFYMQPKTAPMTTPNYGTLYFPDATGVNKNAYTVNPASPSAETIVRSEAIRPGSTAYTPPSVETYV